MLEFFSILGSVKYNYQSLSATITCYLFAVCHCLQYITLVAIVFAAELACGIIAIIYKDNVSYFLVSIYGV